MPRILALLAAAGALLLMVVLTATSCAFDVEDAVAECPEGGSVIIPEGEYTIGASLMLKDGMTIRGEGVGKTILTMGAQSQPTALIGGDGVAGVTISDLILSSPSPAGNVFGIWISNHSGVYIERVRIQGCAYGLKVDTRGEDLSVRDFMTRGCGQNYISNLQRGTFENLDLEAVTERLASDMTSHTLYLASNNHQLHFKNLRVAGGSGWTLHMYCPDQLPSDDISFEGLIVEGRWAVVAVNFGNVTFTDVNAGASMNDHPVFEFSGGPLDVDGFRASGGSSLVRAYAAQGVSLRNGTYVGEVLNGGDSAESPEFENVTLLAPSTVP
jgi:hypothetical protein